MIPNCDVFVVTSTSVTPNIDGLLYKAYRVVAPDKKTAMEVVRRRYPSARVMGVSTVNEYKEGAFGIIDLP